MTGVARLWGLVLAAGASSRMRRPKALLVCPGSDETFVARAARVLHAGGVPKVAVVARPGDRALAEQAARLRPAVEVVENPRPERGQLASLLAGIGHAETAGAEAVVVLPVDMPLIRVASVAALLAAAVQHRAPIVRVVHHGRHGHPILFRRAVFDRLRALDVSAGANALARERAEDVLDVPVEDPGVLRDVDWPEEYRQLFDPPAEL
jgi:molybdenum cofactor cytidylyltransferase